MTKKELFQELDDCYDYGDKNGMLENIKNYQKSVTEEDASRDLAEYIFLKYTTYKADAMAGIMQMILQDNPNLALLQFPDNYFFRLAVLKGSVDLYQCFIEEAIEPFLEGKDENEISDYYMELYSVASNLNDKFFPEYVPCVKGLDFNGAFGHDENNPTVVLIDGEDYETMNDAVEKYNTILGRRDIIKYLEEIM